MVTRHGVDGKFPRGHGWDPWPRWRGRRGCVAAAGSTGNRGWGNSLSCHGSEKYRTGSVKCFPYILDQGVFRVDFKKVEG